MGVTRGARHHAVTGDAAPSTPSQTSDVERRTHRSSWLVLGAVALPVLCCALPTLLAAGALTAVGTGLAAHGFWLAAGPVLLIAGAMAGWWWLHRRRCKAPDS